VETRIWVDDDGGRVGGGGDGDAVELLVAVSLDGAVVVCGMGWSAKEGWQQWAVARVERD
jgi:hypothetical protein